MASGNDKKKPATQPVENGKHIVTDAVNTVIGMIIMAAIALLLVWMMNALL